MCPSGKVAALPGRDTSGSDALPGKEAASKDLFDTWDENDFLRFIQANSDWASF